MPAITDKEIFDLLLLEAESITLTISKQEEDKAKQEANDYLAGTVNDLKKLQPLSIYFVLSKLSSTGQINFIRENIDYLKEHDNDIFLYRKEAPKELVYFFSYEVIKSIYQIDRELFEKINEGNIENIFEKFIHADYFEYFKEFKDYIQKMAPHRLLQIFPEHGRVCFKEELTKETLKTKEKYDKEFITFFQENFSEKIASFPPADFLTFISYLKDKNEYQNIVFQNQEKLRTALETMADYELCDYLVEYTVAWQQEILFSEFLDVIVKTQDIKKIAPRISQSVILNMYKKDKNTFSNMTLLDWLKLWSENHAFDDRQKVILADYVIDDITSLFDKSFLPNFGIKKDITALKFLENKYRSALKGDTLTPVSKITSITSSEYFNNLAYLKENLKNKNISKNSSIYEDNLAKFIVFLKENNIISDLNTTSLIEINKYFYRTIMGLELANIYRITSIEEIALSNRLHSEEINASNFTVEQLQRFNIKHYRKLFELSTKSNFMEYQIKNYLLKLMLLVGYDHAKTILEIENDVTTLEHLVGNVDVKNIKLDVQGNPILNKKLINLLFSDKFTIREIIQNKDSDFYKYLPRIFNEWEMIKINNKDESFATIIEFLKSNEITLPPKYYRLTGLFKHIGCKNEIVAETLSLHDQMLAKYESTIPQISGNLGNYYYEILRSDNPEGLVVGNLTNCCFTILGNGYSCLKHALTSKNGRILVVKKDDELIAHSWLWRNGDLLCLDNIEISKSLDEVDFLNVYQKFADEILMKSLEEEGPENCLKNVTIGYTNFDKEILGNKNLPLLILKDFDLTEKDFDSRLGPNRIFLDKLPSPLEEIKYTDSKNVQILLKGTGNFRFGEPTHTYLEERNPIMHYLAAKSYDSDYIETLTRKINALRYLKSEEEEKVSSYESINLKDIVELHCNDDWYSIIYQDGTEEEYFNTQDPRGKKEMLKEKTTVYTKKL